MTTYQLTSEGRSRMIALLDEHFDRDDFIELVTTFGGPGALDELVEGKKKRVTINQYVLQLEKKGRVGSEFFDRWRDLQKDAPARITEISALEQYLQLRPGVHATRELQSPIAQAGTAKTAPASTPGLQIIGDPDALRLICKVSGATFVKSTKAIELPGGCLVQVSTKERNVDGSFAVAEAMSFVPGVRLAANADGQSWRFTRDGSD